MNKNYKRPLIIDGAMGTELMNLWVDLPLPLWSSVANFDEYDKVVDIHKRYINAGSDIITSNTFRTTARTFKKAGYTDEQANEISKRCTSEAIKAAKEAIEVVQKNQHINIDAREAKGANPVVKISTDPIVIEN